MRLSDGRQSGSRNIMAEWLIEPLRNTHERGEFSYGKPSLDTFLQTYVSQYEKRRLGRTFVATEPGKVRVAGYYTLAAGSVGFNSLPQSLRKKLPEHPIPTIHLARLAVDSGYQGKRLGETLLLHALRAALDLSESLGAFAVDLWAIDEAARGFYQKYGFIQLEDDSMHLFLSMKTIESGLPS
jgi:ribosomal protein S18 acetylase RimI-like enzyme